MIGESTAGDRPSGFPQFFACPRLLATTFIAQMMDRRRWIVYVGFALITFVALDMTWRGADRLANNLT